MKTTVLLRAVHLMGWLVLLILGAPVPSVAQDATPQPLPKITPLWTVTDKFCSPNERCGQMWRLSADGEHLFVYIVPTTTMYVYSKGQDKVRSYKVNTYPATTFPDSFDQDFSYFPLDDHVILYPDRASGGKLMRLDLQTSEARIFGVKQGLVSCLNHWYGISWDAPIGAAFHYLPTIHELLVCRKTRNGYENSAPVLISTINLKSGHIKNVVDVGQGDYSYLNVVGGRDGGVYLEPGPGVSQQDGTRLIMRWNASISRWDRIEFPDSILDNNDFHSPRFMGVDIQSNLYFESDFAKDIRDIRERLIITKVNPTTKAVQIIKEDQLGWKPYFMGLDADGQMIILNRMSLPSANTTVDVISRYEFDAAEK